MNHIFLTFSSKYQGETMFCFVCVATVFGYILGVNRVIDAIISKHSDETRVKTLNKYTQTNFGEIAELLALNHLILSPTSIVNDVSSSSDQSDKSDLTDVANETNNEVASNSISHPHHNQDKNEKKENQEKQVQENTIMSPSSTSSVSTSEEDYELVRKNENINHSKNKNNSKSKYFEWFTIF
jgi:hypothetical protein